MFFQDFLGGMTLKRMPSEKGSSESTSSSSALPPIVIIWYISLSRSEMRLKPCMKPSSRLRRSSSQRRLTPSRAATAASRSALRAACSSTRRRYSASTPSSTFAFCVFSSSTAISAFRLSLLRSASSSLVYVGSSSVGPSSTPRSLLLGSLA